MKNRFYLLFAYLTLFGIAAFERFYRLTVIGLDGSDTFFYWEMARQYLNGQFLSSEHYRPLAYGLYAAAMGVGGVNYHSIKFLNCGLDLMNGALAAVIAYRLSRRPWAGFLAAGLYFALVEPVFQARTELLHIPSATPFLLAVLCLTYLTEHAGRAVWSWGAGLVLTGALVGIAANIHPTLALTAPGFVLTIWLWSQFRERDSEWPRMTVGTGGFSVGFALPFILVAWVMGAHSVAESMSANRGAQTESLARFGSNLVWAMKSFFPENSSVWMAALFAAMLFYLFRTGVLRRRPFGWTAILVLMLSYAFLYVLLVPKFRLVRTFLPLMPLAMVLMSVVLWDITRSWRRAGRWLAIAVVWISSAISVRQSLAAPYLYSWSQPSTVYLEVKNTLADLAPKDRILVAPLIARNHRGPLTQNAYFGDRATYLIHMQVDNPKNWLAREGITHVVFLKETWDERVTRQPEFGLRNFRKRVGPYFNLKIEEYAPERELDYWRATLPDLGYVIMVETERMIIWRKL